MGLVDLTRDYATSELFMIRRLKQEKISAQSRPPLPFEQLFILRFLMTPQCFIRLLSHRSGRK